MLPPAYVVASIFTVLSKAAALVIWLERCVLKQSQLPAEDALMHQTSWGGAKQLPMQTAEMGPTPIFWISF